MSMMRRGLPEAIGSWIVTAVLSLSNVCSPAAEQQFDRLFTTKEQRQRLQELRERNRQKAREPDLAGTGTHGTRAGSSRSPGGNSKETPVVTLRGLIYKKDRAGMAWINARDGSAGLDYRKLESGQVLDNGVTIRVPATDMPVKLKPGQSYHPDTGAVTELREGDP